jgi:hypothetical protein
VQYLAGIRVISHKHEIPKGKMMVQKYIANPFLVDGYKSDIRVYVVGTCFDPLRLYIHEDGLVPGMLTQGARGAPGPLASRLYRIPTHFLLNLHGI